MVIGAPKPGKPVQPKRLDPAAQLLQLKVHA
jgi:hypothetical protein